jgi:hypothetical protein
MVYHCTVLQNIDTFYTTNLREPTEDEERYLYLYIQQMRQYKATGALRPEFIAAVDEIMPWFIWDEATATAAAVAATTETTPLGPEKIQPATLLDYATIILFLYSLGRLLNSVYSQYHHINWYATLTPGAWGLWSWGLWA